MNDYQKMQLAKAQIVGRLIDNAPDCTDCGTKKSYTPLLYNRYTCMPCRDREVDTYHGTECFCSRCCGDE